MKVLKGLQRKVLSVVGENKAISAEGIANQLNTESGVNRVTEGAVQTAVYRLRKKVDEDIIVTVGDEYVDGLFFEGSKNREKE